MDLPTPTQECSLPLRSLRSQNDSTAGTTGSTLVLDFASLDTFYGAQGQPPTTLAQPNPKNKDAAGFSYNISSSPITLPLTSSITFFGAVGQPPQFLPMPNPSNATNGVILLSWNFEGNVRLIGQEVIFGAPGQVPNYGAFSNPIPGAIPRDSLTWISTTKVLLLGQDTFFGALGQPLTYDWPLPKAIPPSPALHAQINFTKLRLLIESITYTLPGVPQFMWSNPLAKRDVISLRIIAEGARQCLTRQDTFFGLPGQPRTQIEQPRPQEGVRPRLSNRTAYNYIDGTMRSIEIFPPVAILGLPVPVVSTDTTIINEEDLGIATIVTALELFY